MEDERKIELRVEEDVFGLKKIPADAYYGIQSERARENFPITGHNIHPELIKSLGMVKWASAKANMELGKLSKDIGQAIKQASQEMISGKFDDQFIIDVIHGGAGTPINMNANEIIANRAVELLGGKKGDYTFVSPNTHVNMSQSTNDVIPTAFKIAITNLSKKLIANLDDLHDALFEKEKEFDDVLKTGRTHLQDAVPIRLGQEFGAYTRFVFRDIKRINKALKELKYINLGATAVGTGLNADQVYIEQAKDQLNYISGLELEISEHLVDSTQNMDDYLNLSGTLKTCAVNLSKMCNDLRLMASGPRCGFGEISLPVVQAGSSIMPGKVNPVITEVINQISFQVIGNDKTITMAAEAGQLDLNVMTSVLFHNLFESLESLTNGAYVLTEKCIKGIMANKEHCKEQAEKNIGIITALNPHIGYEKASEIALKALKTGRGVRDVVVEEGALSEEKVNRILHPKEMTEPGIAGDIDDDGTAGLYFDKK
ncbi:aspartate ammonia-lyase [Natranaerofaba carboxydovora]|uniref:aspartate ammonia-lyase n=1 Tax=Natranaerofaba carboxydovora TaxID=2742683 RepID=UPI001F141507|nr:aspartate ammonia-lyase [Natranaerofaba carboxydovora]UMZ74655.1 Aspartate ammonia-lyase [Natranaerofaba carboxydovora]